jgi:multisubunit Na+/H+ antiporter MnhC subunit
MKFISHLFFLFITIPLIVISAVVVIIGIYLSVFHHSFDVIIGRVLVVVGSSVFIYAAQFFDKR